MNRLTAWARKAVMLAVLLAAVTACTTVTKPRISPEPNVYGDVLWPEVSLFYKEPSDQLRSRCTEFNKYSVLQHCDMTLLKLDYELEQFQKSNYFADVKFSDRDIDFAIAITQANFLDESAGGIANAALTGATLLLVPFTQHHDVVVEVAIFWRGNVIRQMEYELTYAQTISLYENPEQAKIELAGEIAARIIEDIKRDDVFTGQYLAKTLDASDYTDELVAPDRVGEYLKSGETALGDPFEGAAFSYARPEFQFDEYVVSIYPIRATSWIDYAAVLAAEMALIRADFDAALKAGEWRAVTFGDQQELLVKTPGGGNVGIMQTVNLVDINGEPFIGRIYLLIEEDKIIGVSNFVPAAYAQPDPQEFLSSFFPALQVPAESIYMAKKRQQQREYDLR